MFPHKYCCCKQLGTIRELHGEERVNQFKKSVLSKSDRVIPSALLLTLIFDSFVNDLEAMPTFYSFQAWKCFCVHLLYLNLW